jgi:Chromate transporter
VNHKTGVRLDDIAAHSAETKGQRKGSPLEVLLVFLRLGVTCFGGPIAHIGYFRNEFVVRRRWIDEQAYADLVGLCQFLPGPASSQVGFSIGWLWCSSLTARVNSEAQSGSGCCMGSSLSLSRSSPRRFGAWHERCAPTGNGHPLRSRRR